MSTDLRSEWDARQVFEGELLPEESILWYGQPDASRLFSKADIMLIPFSLFWGGFAVFWEFGVLSSILKHGIKDPVDLIFPLFGVPFLVIGSYFIFGRFIYKRWKRQRTYYALTNKRVLIKSAKGSVQALFINALPGLNKSVRADGTGTVMFGDIPPMSALDDTGMECFGQKNATSITAFYDIKDADSVYQLASKLKLESVSSS